MRDLWPPCTDRTVITEVLLISKCKIVRYICMYE